MHVLGAGDDHVVDAPAHLEVAVFAAHGDVAGAVPATLHLFGGRVRAVEVAEKGRVGGCVDQQLALLADGGDLLDRAADAANAHVGVVAGPVVVRLAGGLRKIQAVHDLGGAVDVGHPAAGESGRDALEQRSGHRGAGVDHGLHAPDFFGGEIRRGQQAVKMRRRAVEERDAVALDRFHRLDRVEHRAEVVGAVERQRPQEAGEKTDRMKKRHQAKHLVMRAVGDAALHRHVEHPGVGRAMRDHDALGQPGRA